MTMQPICWLLSVHEISTPCNLTHVPSWTISKRKTWTWEIQSPDTGTDWLDPAAAPRSLGQRKSHRDDVLRKGGGGAGSPSERSPVQGDLQGDMPPSGLQPVASVMLLSPFFGMPVAHFTKLLAHHMRWHSAFGVTRYILYHVKEQSGPLLRDHAIQVIMN